MCQAETGRDESQKLEGRREAGWAGTPAGPWPDLRVLGAPGAAGWWRGRETETHRQELVVGFVSYSTAVGIFLQAKGNSETILT